MRTIADVVTRLRAEFREMPGLRLTRPQVERLCGIESTICQMVLDSLVNERFLLMSADGHYTRPSGGALFRSASGEDRSVRGPSVRAS
jgi:hypothetical protein